ncbi:MAG: hypothetical protein OXE81_07930 [Gammaproteobacteria bacterium]|nr:hypothetical protein [Gammaproteobacteria bacterium]
MNQQDIAEQPWRKLLLTPEEEAQRIADRYFIDPETDELVGKNPNSLLSPRNTASSGTLVLTHMNMRTSCTT